MLIGYARVSKSDGSQTLNLQVDALRSVGVESNHIYKDEISTRGLKSNGTKTYAKKLLLYLSFISYIMTKSKNSCANVSSNISKVESLCRDNRK